MNIKYSNNTMALLINDWQSDNLLCNSFRCNNNLSEKAIISFSKHSKYEVYTDFYCSDCLNIKIKEGRFSNNYIIIDLKDINPNKIIKQLNQIAILL